MYLSNTNPVTTPQPPPLWGCHSLAPSPCLSHPGPGTRPSVCPESLQLFKPAYRKPAHLPHRLETTVKAPVRSSPQPPGPPRCHLCGPQDVERPSSQELSTYSVTSPPALLASPDLDANKPCNLMQAVVSIKSLLSFCPQDQNPPFQSTPQPMFSFLSPFQLLSGQDFTLHFLQGPPCFRELQPRLSKPSKPEFLPLLNHLANADTLASLHKATYRVYLGQTPASDHPPIPGQTQHHLSWTSQCGSPLLPSPTHGYSAPSRQ